MIKDYNHTDTERNCCHCIEQCRAKEPVKKIIRLSLNH